jgi:RimJ/RimL family protein N-acetyltransferase
MPSGKSTTPAQQNRHPVFSTERLHVYVAGIGDVDLYYRLWNEPRVMANVGYPYGLRLTRQEIATQLQEQAGRVLDARLVIVLRSTGESIGECKLGSPDANGVSSTDVKLLPEFWGNKYGVEVKRALVAYLFAYTDCRVVEATPNVHNIASIKMQEAVGAVCVGETLFEFSEELRDFTQTIRSYVYHVRRETWSPS